MRRLSSMNVSKRPIPALLSLATLLLGGCGGPEGPGESSELPFELWVADTMTAAQAASVTEAVGAQLLSDRVAMPSPWLTDHFGVQILKPLTAEEVRFDLVPLYAEVAGETPYALTLRFASGLEVVFRFNTVLFRDGNQMAVPYARIELSNPAGYPQQTEEFRRILVEAGLAERYLEPNPYFAAEQEAWDRLLEPDLLDPVEVLTDTAAFQEELHGVFLVPETHVGSAGFNLAEEMVLSPLTDWVGLEMLPEDLQPLLDRYLVSPEGSEGWQDARDALLRFYGNNWNSRGIEVTRDPVDNPYFRLIDLARSADKSVIALDASELYVAFRFGDLPLGASTRDYLWASRVPSTGRGVVYGEASHLDPGVRPSFLTFLRERFPEIGVFGVPSGS